MAREPRGERELAFEQHMSDNEALMWNLEKDPALSSWFASVSILDTAPSMERLRNRLLYVASTVPRLRHRVVSSLGRWSPPRWVEDHTFDIDYHVRRIGAPAPGGSEELAEVAVKILLDPFDRSRPLWQFIVVDGLADGRAALIQKMHHTITDGEGGVRLAERFVDLERDAVDPEPKPFPEAEAPIASLVHATTDTVGHNVRRVSGLARRSVGSVVTNPFGAAKGTSAVLNELGKVVRPPSDGTTTGSPLWQPRTLRRWFGTLSYDFDDVHAAAKARGGTINDLFVAGALSGCATYHLARDANPDRFRVAMPVSQRSDGTAGGNNFAITTTELAAVADPEDAFLAVRAGLNAARSGDAVDILGSLSMVINLLPTSVLTRVAKDSAAAVDFTVSNVRGAPFPIYMAGAKVENVYPMGPISGTGFNLTTMSYDGRLDMGLVADAGAIEHPPELRVDIDAAYQTLIDG